MAAIVVVVQQADVRAGDGIQRRAVGERLGGNSGRVRRHHIIFPGKARPGIMEAGGDIVYPGADHFCMRDGAI